MRMKLTLKGSSSSGWYSPPEGTHTGEKHRAIGSGKATKGGKPEKELAGKGEDVLKFSNEKNADDWASSQASLNPTDLTDEQNEAMQQYKTDDYATLNDELRMGGYSEMRLNSDPDVYMEDVMDSVFVEAALPEPVIVYRGFSWHTFEDDEDLTNAIITDDAFVSTSMVRDIAEAHSLGVMMEIMLPKGAKAIWMDKWRVTGWDTESELLLNKGSKFKVISDVRDPSKYTREMVAELVI